MAATVYEREICCGDQLLSPLFVSKCRETLFTRNVSLFKDSLVKSKQQVERSERLRELEERENAVLIKEMAAQNTNTKRALDLATVISVAHSAFYPMIWV